jgi:hypothetical protein
VWSLSERAVPAVTQPVVWSLSERAVPNKKNRPEYEMSMFKNKYNRLLCC